MRHVFQSFWFGETITPYEGVCLRSFIDQGHDFDLYTYTADLEVPAGVGVRDAREFFAPEEYFTYKKGPGRGSHAAFSNLFRYKLLKDRGGWWVDTDVVCLSPDIPAFDEFFAYETSDIVNGAVLYFAPRDPIMVACLEDALTVKDEASWGEIGPRLITRKLREHNRLADALEQSVCYPIGHLEALNLLRPGQKDALADRISGSLFLHLWNEVLRRVNLNKYLLPPPGSLLRRIADRHPVDGWRGEYNGIALEHILSAESALRAARVELARASREAQRLDKQCQNLQSRLQREKERRLKVRLRRVASQFRRSLTGASWIK